MMGVSVNATMPEMKTDAASGSRKCFEYSVINVPLAKDNGQENREQVLP